MKKLCKREKERETLSSHDFRLKYELGWAMIEVQIDGKTVGTYHNIKHYNGQTNGQILKIAMKELLEKGEYSDWYCKKFKIDKNTKLRLIYGNRCLDNE